MATAIMCQVGGSIVDPTILIKDLPNLVVLNFKIAPLLGGPNMILSKPVLRIFWRNMEFHPMSVPRELPIS